MKRDFNPVDVELSIENPSIERGAFYRLCFITESDIAPRTLKVTRLQDLLDNGYSRLDLAYNFCVGVFSQQGMDTVYIRAKRSYESYVEAYNSDDNSMYYFVVLQTKNLTEIEIFNRHLVSSDEMKLQFFSQNVGSKILQSPKLVNYYQDYTRPEGGVSSGDRDYYLNKAYEGSDAWVKMPLPDYLLEGYGDDAVDYGVGMMVGKDYIWEMDKPNRRIRYARSVVESGWVGSREESTVNNSEVTVVATKGSGGKLLRAIIKDPKVKIETISRELLKGLGKEVLDYAIPLIDPEAKDWVLEPTNNRVVYKSVVPYYTHTWVNLEKFNTADEACRAVAIAGDRVYLGINSDGKCTVRRPDSTFVEELTIQKGNATETLYLTLAEISAKIIANAEAGHLESEEFLKSIPLFAYLLTGSGTEAVNKAVLDIDPEATNWVLDPANNSIKYAETGWYGSESEAGGVFKTKEEACTASYQSAVQFYGASNITGYELNGTMCTVHHKSKDFNYQMLEADNTDETKTIPIDTVSAQVISNAESGHVPSQEALRLSTVERVNTGEYDEALEAASTEIDTSWKYLPIYDVAVQVKRNSIAGHAESIEAVNNSLPFELPNYEPELFINGEITSGSTVIAELSDNNRLPEEVDYTWYVNNSKVGTGNSYTIKPEDEENTLKVTATYMDLDEHSEEVSYEVLVEKSYRTYWETEQYPKQTLVDEVEGGYLQGESYSVKAAPLDINIKEVLTKYQSEDSYRVKATPKDISLVSIMKSRFASDSFSVKAEPKDITLKEIMNDYSEEDSYVVKATPLDISNTEVLVKNYANDTYSVKATPLDISKTKIEVIK